MPKCKLCGKEATILTYHVKKVHELTKEQYLIKFPNAELTDPSVRERLKNNSKDRWSGEGAEKQKEEAAKRISKRNKKNWEDEEYRKKMTEVLTDNNHKMMPELREKVKKSSKKAWSKNTPEVEERRRKAKDVLKKANELQWTPEKREKMSIKLTEMNKSGQIRYTTNKVEYKGDTFKSSWEFGFALYLEDAGLEYQYEPKTFVFEYDGRKHRYTPDFYVPELDSYYEVKGWYKDKENILRKKSVVEESGAPCIMVDKEYVAENGIKEFIQLAQKIMKGK